MKNKTLLFMALVFINTGTFAYYEKNGLQKAALAADQDNYFMGRFDTNGDGKVTKVEFLALAAERFKNMDVNGDKVISLEEFLQRYADFQTNKLNPSQNTKQPEPEKVFVKLDANGDKKVTEVEYSESRNKWFRQLDKNQDAQVTIDEARH